MSLSAVPLPSLWREITAPEKSMAVLNDPEGPELNLWRKLNNRVLDAATGNNLSVGLVKDGHTTVSVSGL
jgi:hypothetical protein